MTVSVDYDPHGLRYAVSAPMHIIAHRVSIDSAIS